ncbi:uncharacterized protein RSE6_05029 [Rhynchosporium secalis]|uniref:Uncharacterized protein n=1 Tax=Rhynchosporium secalis TaxID=38038 RepID=A0A1E1M7Z3_RHYSE|nr:uncharacterized protein RSE6_05029 [Rhynchosporium secalis]
MADIIKLRLSHSKGECPMNDGSRNFNRPENQAPQNWLVSNCYEDPTSGLDLFREYDSPFEAKYMISPQIKIPKPALQEEKRDKTEMATSHRPSDPEVQKNLEIYQLGYIWRCCNYPQLLDENRDRTFSQNETRESASRICLRLRSTGKEEDRKLMRD